MKTKKFFNCFKRNFFNVKLKKEFDYPFTSPQIMKKDNKEIVIDKKIIKESNSQVHESISLIHSKELISKMIDLNSSNELVYRACVEPIIINQNKEILVFFHRTNRTTTFLLSLKYTLPITVLFYLIKTNPFYVTFPAMLPLMTIGLSIYLCLLFGYIRRLKYIVNEIWLDPSGKEVKIIYRNMRYRKFRDEAFEDIILINSLTTPNTEDRVKLKGSLFPNSFPFDEDLIFDRHFFWTKYFLSNRNYFLIPKRAIYTNYEILVNAFNGRPIDFSHVEAYQINFEGQSKFQVFYSLNEINKYKKEKIFK